MKKQIPIFCNTISAALVIYFIVKCLLDYSRYTTTFSSAPFSLWVLVNAVQLLLPAVLLFGVGFLAKKHYQLKGEMYESTDYK